MAKMKYITVKSALTKIEGKYTGQFLSNGSVYLDELAKKICKDRPAVDEPELKFCVRALVAEIKAEVVENLNYVTTGTLCAFAPAISGSVPAMDAALGPDNAFYVNVQALAPLANAIGAVVPTRDKSDAAKIVVDDIEDRASHKRKTIVGTREFVVTGFNLSAKADGESLNVLNPDGTTVTPATVTSEDGCGQRIVAQLSASVPTGNYTLQLNTHGYATPEADVETYTKKIHVQSA